MVFLAKLSVLRQNLRGGRHGGRKSFQISFPRRQDSETKIYMRGLLGLSLQREVFHSCCLSSDPGELKSCLEAKALLASHLDQSFDAEASGKGLVSLSGATLVG
jgi:hypothetical protein